MIAHLADEEPVKAADIQHFGILGSGALYERERLIVVPQNAIIHIGIDSDIVEIVCIILVIAGLNDTVALEPFISACAALIARIVLVFVLVVHGFCATNASEAVHVVYPFFTEQGSKLGLGARSWLFMAILSFGPIKIASPMLE